MQKRILLITLVLLMLIFSCTLCFSDGNKSKPKPKGPWQDLTNFNEFIETTFPVTEKEVEGSKIIKDIADPEGSLYVLVGTDVPVTDSEAVALHQFVEEGGNIIVASDNSNANILAKKFGVEYTKQGILDKDFDYNYTFIPVMTEYEGMPFSIIVHSPRGLNITAQKYSIVGRSSYIPDKINSVLDVNENRIIDGKDIPGPISIIVEVQVKEGKAIFIADAGLFSDNLWKLVSKSDKPEFSGRIYDNQEYIIDIISRLYREGGTFIYDTSKQTMGHSNFHPYPTSI